MTLAAIPVGAHKRTLGLSGWPPGFLRIFSACVDMALIVADFPTPTNKRISFQTNLSDIQSVPAPPWMISLSGVGLS